GLRMIEGVPVVTELRDAAAEKAGIQLGDVVVGVAGEAVEKRMARLGKYIAASTPAAHKLYTLQRLLNGPDNSTCKLNVRGPDGKTREVELPRRAAYWRASVASKRKVFEALPGNLGYVDLTRLEQPQIDPMLEELKDTTAIIFDLRGYPRGTFFLLGPRLNVKNARHAAEFRRPLVGGASEGSFTF